MNHSSNNTNNKLNNIVTSHEDLKEAKETIDSRNLK